MAPKDEDGASSGDPLKYYCIVFALLIAVIGFVYFRQKSQLDAYAEENAHADSIMADLEASTVVGSRPRGFPALGLAVERMVAGYANAIGTDGDSRGISTAKIGRMVQDQGAKVTNWGGERVDVVARGGYEQVELEVTIEDVTLATLSAILHNIEAGTRYRVFDVQWTLRQKAENAMPPHHALQRATLRVGFRRPIATGGGT